jgi:hypothetical protein
LVDQGKEDEEDEVVDLWIDDQDENHMVSVPETRKKKRKFQEKFEKKPKNEQEEEIGNFEK